MEVDEPGIMTFSSDFVEEREIRSRELKSPTCKGRLVDDRVS